MARGHVFKDGDTWHYWVSDGEKIVAADNTASWRPIFDAALASAVAFTKVQRVGHRIEKSFAQLVDEAEVG